MSIEVWPQLAPRSSRKHRAGSHQPQSCKSNRAPRTPLIRWLLDDNKNEVLIGRNHDLMLLRPNSQECEVIGWIQVPDDAPGLVAQLTHESGVLHRRGVVHRALDRNSWKRCLIDIRLVAPMHFDCHPAIYWETNELTFIVDDNRPSNAFVWLNSFQSFFDFLRLKNEFELKPHTCQKGTNVLTIF